MKDRPLRPPPARFLGAMAGPGASPAGQVREGRGGGWEAPSGPLYSLLHLRVRPPSEGAVDTRGGSR